jgi:hypothetical protein
VRTDGTPAAAPGEPEGQPSVARPRWPPERDLSASELHRLTLYKWRYALEALGFAGDQVRNLMFLKWLLVSQRLRP